jgi:hypothetical protein
LREEDQKCILINGGIKIFLSNSLAEASTSVAHEEVLQQESKKEAMGTNDFKGNCVYDAGATKVGQPAETIKEEEEKEKTLMFSRVKGEENSIELLKIFSQEAEQEMIAALESAVEGEAANMDFAELYEELERRVNMQSRNIQQVKLETYGGAYQPGEKLKEVGVEPT